MDILVYPVSIVMKFWHSVLSFVVSPDSGIAWVGSVLLLVVTVRLLLLRSMWRQQYSLRKMSQLAPQLQKIQKEHKNDRAKLAEEMQKVYSEAKVNPLAGCLPFLVQIPVFLGLYFVLLNFSPRGKTIEEASQMSNGAFGPDDVASFLNAEMFGVPLSAYLTMPQDVLESLHPGLERPQVAAVLVPLFVLAGVATYVNMRNSFRRQEAAKKAEEEARERAELEERAGGPVVDGEVVEREAADGDTVEGETAALEAGDGTSADGAVADETQADDDADRDDAARDDSGDDEDSREKKDEGSSDRPEMPSLAESMQESMNSTMKMMMYIFPFFPIFGAIAFQFPMAIGIYWFTNNIWTAVQSHIFLEKLEKELPMTSRDGLPPSAFM